MESPWTARQTLWGALQAKLLSCHVKTMHSLNNIIDGDYMAVLCRDMHALGGGGAGGLWALHVQYVVSIANSAVGAAVYGLADCLAVGFAWLGWVAVYNPVACLLSVRTAAAVAASPKVLTASLCIQILGMRQCHTISLYIFLFSCHLLLSFFEFLSFFSALPLCWPHTATAH